MSDVAQTENVVTTVTMADGSSIDFSHRATKRSLINLAEGTLTFNLISGAQHTLSVTTIPFLTDYYTYPEAVRRLIMDGIRGKVNSTINNTPDKEVGEAIEKAYDTFRNGGSTRTIVYRGNLTKEEHAFALVVVNHPDIKELEGSQEVDWSNLSANATIQEVKATWEGKSKKERNSIRRNAWFMRYFSDLSLGVVPDVIAKAHNVAEVEEDVDNSITE